jgi:hypothetical protein
MRLLTVVTLQDQGRDFNGKESQKVRLAWLASLTVCCSTSFHMPSPFSLLQNGPPIDILAESSCRDDVKTLEIE